MKLKTFAVIQTILMLFASARGADGDRIIQADLAQVKGPTSMVWQDCVGAGRVGEGLRDGWRRQLEICHRELGFKYLRAHGLLTDEMGIYKEDAEGNPRYNWQYVDDVYDFLFDTGVRPFVELSFMPKALASGTNLWGWWNANVTPPKDYAKWDALMTAMVKHWTDRYGAEEVKKWRFEVWNEPQLPMFFQPQGKSRRDAYFELYEHTAKDVKAVNPDYIVGGPSGAGPQWIGELINFCTKSNVPLDFISFHSYGLGGGGTGGGPDENGKDPLYLSPRLQAVARISKSQSSVIANSGKPNLPVYITEWSTSYTSRDPIHDSYFSAPYILEQLRNTEQLGCMSYWVFTDVFEEEGPAARPFHGGFGLINYQGIEKPAFRAYWCLAQLGATEIKSSDVSSYVCKDSKGGAQVLFWDLTFPLARNQSDQDYFYKPHPAKDKGSVTVKLANLPAGEYRLATYRIGYQHNDPYSRYLEMGRPTDLSREEVVKLKALSSGKPDSESSVTVNGEFSTTLPMQENSVYLLIFTPVAKDK